MSSVQDRLRQRLLPFLENTSEATAACLVAMVQGNLLTLTLSHWLIASQTGIAAGALAAVAIFVSRANRPWVISATLGVVTALADYFTHEGMFGPFFLEALVTGAVAGLLSFGVQALIRRIRA